MLTYLKYAVLRYSKINRLVRNLANCKQAPINWIQKMRILSRSLFFIGIILVTLLAFSLPAQALEKNDRFSIAGMTKQQAAHFLLQLQSAVKKNDLPAIAKLTHFPLNVYHEGKQTIIQNKAALRQHYDTVFTDRVKAAVLSQSLDNLFVNYQGVMIGNGELWFANYTLPSYNADRILIKTINN